MFERLPVVLTEEELKEKANIAARLYREVEELEEEKGASAADYTARIKGKKASISALSRAITDGREFRDIEVEWKFLWDEGVKTLVRVDTGEVIREEAISTVDRQGELPVGPPPIEEPIPEEEDIPEDPPVDSRAF